MLKGIVILFSLIHNKTSKSKILINNKPHDRFSDLSHERLLRNQKIQK